MRIRLWITFTLILVLTGLAGYLNWPGKTHIGGRDITLRQGLDLKGGAYLVYAAKTDEISSAQKRTALEGVRLVFQGRIDQLGVAEPELRVGETSDGTPTLNVSLPGIADLEEAKARLGSTAQLQFMDETGTVLMDGTDIVPARTNATPSLDSQGLTTGGWEIQLTLTREGQDKFAAATAANVGKPIYIVLDDQIISNPVVQETINSTEARITGNFTAEEARDIATQLKSGALPVPVELIQEQTVGATLGSDAVNKSLIAGIIAVFLVMVFMAAYYKWCGLIASLALVIFVLLNMTVFRLMPVTMTLAGIAGFIISIGMAVDTNILTFERLKEELRLEKPIPVAVRDSFRRSWTSIRDSHVAGLISAFIIFSFASGPVRGFAVVLIIGLLLSLFTAITVTRNWMMLVAGSRFQKMLKP